VRLVAAVAWAVLAASSSAQEARPRLSAPRLSDGFEGEHRAAKQALLDRINHDRRQNKVGKLRVDPLATQVADAFCQALAEAGSVSHYDSAGRAPYLRWAMAGGIAYHGENVSAYSSGAGTLDRDVASILPDLHASMMAEAPPDDGHRRLLLNAEFTAIGIGVAVKGGELRLCEELTRPTLEWAEVPSHAEAGRTAALLVQPASGWVVVAIDVLHEPPPRPRPPDGGKTYDYPAVATTLYPARAAGYGVPLTASGGGTFSVTPTGRVSFDLPLRAGPGHYYALLQVRPRGSKGRPSAGAVLMVEAR
jgi:uncharacterized protein YkwD